MKLKQFLHSSAKRSERGFTVIELLVASGLGLVVTGIALATFVFGRELIKYDMQRTVVTQNLRSSLDIIGINIRLAGENLPAAFPAIEIIDGGAGPDELILRRNLRDEVLKVCDILTSGSSDALFFSVAGTTPGCIYADQVQNQSVWNDYLTEEGGDALGYVYEPSSDTGQFFWFDGVVDGGTDLSLTLSGSTWDTDYPVGAAAYLLEEWHFQLQGDLLVVIPEEQAPETSRVMYDISDFQVQVEFNDGTVQDTLDSTDDWTEVKYIEVTLSALETVNGKTIDRSLSSRFFPRNVLSN